MASKKVILCPNPFRDERLAAAKRSKEILENVGLQTVVCLPFNREGYGRGAWACRSGRCSRRSSPPIC